MMNKFFSSIIGLLAVVAPLAGEANADTFEFLTYKPPAGWTKQATQGGIAYRRANGVGLIGFYESYAVSGSPSDEFIRMWRARVEPTLPGAPPQPQLERDGEYIAAVGSRAMKAQEGTTLISLVAIVGRGRVIGVLTLAAGDDVIREVTAFLDTLTIKPDAPAAPATAPNSGSTSVGGIEVDFDVPPGYTAKRENGMVVLTPTTVNEKTPCAYGVSPSRPSKGSLEADARAAVLEALPGWQIKDEGYNAMRGTAGAGWKYFWFRTIVRNLAGGSYQSAYAMAMAFQGGKAGQVNIVWGVGTIANPSCQLDDLAFSQLFHSLRPRGWTPDGGKAFAQELQGTWQNSQSVGIARYKFMSNGRYDFGYAASSTIGMLETTVSSVGDGSYKLSGEVLTVTPDRRERGVSKYRVRVFDSYFAGRWWRQMSLIEENANPPLDVRYDRVEN